ncbi:winged helix-turn-helix transcriptional regulator [Streptomyces sp. NRRL F-2799]
MLIQQLRALESDGVVRRIVHDEVPCLTWSMN